MAKKVVEPALLQQRADDRKALGERLATARKQAHLTLEKVAKALTDYGYPYGKAAVGAWEVGRNAPDALVMRRLAKLYKTTIDALMWDDSLSNEAIQFAAQFDNLSDAKQKAFRLMWLGYFEGATSDEDVDKAIKTTVRELQRGKQIDDRKAVVANGIKEAKDEG